MLAALSPGSVESVRLDLLRGDAEMIAGNSAFLAPDASSLSGGLGALERAQAWYGAALSQQPSNVRAALGLWRAQVMSGRLLSYLQKNEQAVDLIGRHLDDRRRDHGQEARVGLPLLGGPAPARLRTRAFAGRRIPAPPRFPSATYFVYKTD